MDHKDLLEELKKKFKQFLASNRKDRSLIDPFLREAFSKSSKPHELLLITVRDSGEFYQSKSTSLSGYILEFFEKWSAEIGLNSPVDKVLKEEALFAVCGQRSTHITSLFVKLFEIDKESPESFMFLVEDLVHKQKYDVACRLVALLKLFDKVTVFQFLVPLVAQDKVNIVEEYLNQAGKQVQLELIQYLDSCLASRHQLKDKLVELGVQQVRHEKLHISILSKLIIRLAKKYEISDEQIPFCCRRRLGSSIRYMAQQCFKEGTITTSNFLELSCLGVKDSKELQIDLLEVLLDYRENALALETARKFDLPPSEWPSALQDAQVAVTQVVIEEDWTEGSCYVSATAACDGWVEPAAGKEAGPSRKFYELPFPLDEVKLVDTKERFDEFLVGLSKENIIGVDAEWRPSFDRTTSPVSVIQVATGQETIYVLDMVSLGEVLSAEQRLEFVNQFYREGLLVLGFGFRDDLHKLNIAFPTISEKHAASNSILDVLKLWNHIQSNSPGILPFLKSGNGDNDRRKGLSELVRQCFDIILDKSEQMSDWGRRPLTETQIKYAAIDAYVLVKVFAFLESKHNPEEWKTLIESLIRTKKDQILPKVKKERKKKSRTPCVMPISPFKDIQKEPEHVKIICVSSILGRLGRLLRSCGIDTIFTHSRNHALSEQEIIDLALKEGRFVVSAGGPTQKLMGYLPPGHCYRVLSSDPAIQLREIIVFFNIKVEMKHIFARCQKCNGKEYHKVAQCRMMSISERTGIPPCPSRFTPGEGKPARTADVIMEDVVTCLKTLSVTCNPVCACFDVSAGGEERNITEVSESLLVAGRTSKNAPIGIQDLPIGVLKSVKVFYVCCECGKVYWAGSHTKKALRGCLKYALINSGVNCD